MNFAHYTDAAVALAADLANLLSPEADPSLFDEPQRLTALLEDGGMTLEAAVTPADGRALRTVCRHLREVFSAGEAQEAAARLNAIVASAGVQPELTDHDGTWHMHYAPRGARLAQRVAATTAMGLVTVMAEAGFERLKTCGSDSCEDVFVDLSRNQSRRYCGDRCANRENVAAYRARQREASTIER